MITTHSPGGEPANDVLHSSGARGGRRGRRGRRCPTRRAGPSGAASDGRWCRVHAVRVSAQGHGKSRQYLRHHSGLCERAREVLGWGGNAGHGGHLPQRRRLARLPAQVRLQTYTPQSSPLTYKIGMIHTPWLDWEEALWDYRMQGQMALERGFMTTTGGQSNYISAADFGVGVDGKWGPDKINF